MSTEQTTTGASGPAAEAAALRKALASSTARHRARERGHAVMTFGWRGMLKVKHVPEQLLDVTITPVMFVLMFTYLFGGAIEGSTGDYLDYILGGARDVRAVHDGLFRGRSQHGPDQGRGRPLPVAAHLASGAARGRAARRQRPLRLAGTVIIALGLVLGFRPSAGVGGAVARWRSLSSSRSGSPGSSPP